MLIARDAAVGQFTPPRRSRRTAAGRTGPLNAKRPLGSNRRPAWGRRLNVERSPGYGSGDAVRRPHCRTRRETGGIRSEDEVVILGARADADELMISVCLEAVAGLAVELPACLRALARAVQEQDGVGDDAHRLALLLLGGFPLAPLQSAVDGDATALMRVATDVLRRGAVDAHVEVVRLLREVTVGATTGRVAGDPQTAHAQAGGQRPQLWILGETSH